MDKKILKTELCDILKNAGTQLSLTEIVQLHKAQFGIDVDKYEIASVLHELYHSGKVTEEMDLKTVESFYSYLSEQKSSQIDIAKHEADPKQAAELQKVIDSKKSTESEKWAANVLLSLPKIEKRKDNRQIIDYPVKSIIENGKIDEFCKLLKQRKEIQEIFFTRCYYWPVIREVMSHIASVMPEFFPEAIDLYANNVTVILNNYSANYVKNRAMQEAHRNYEARIYALSDRHQYGEKFVHELLTMDSALSLDEAIEYLNRAISDAKDTKYWNEFISVYNSVCSELTKRHSQSELCESYLNTHNLCYFFTNISDISLIRVMLDTIEAAINNSKYYGYNRDLLVHYAMEDLPENPFLSEEEVNILFKYYPFLSEDDEPKIFADDYSGNLCSVCKIPLEEKRINIAVNDIDGSFYGVFVQCVHACPHCGRIYVTKSDQEKIRKEIVFIKSRKIIRYEFEEEDSSKEYRLHDRSYLDLPVIDMNITIDIDQNNNDHLFDDWDDEEEENDSDYSVNGLSDESFLRRLGYNTEVNTSRRHEILDIAVGRYGKRRVIDMLQFFINMRKHQTRSYSYAINVWRDDIQYVISH